MIQVGDFIFFGLKPARKKLGIKEAEQVYDSATELIKNDKSGAVPFAIMATAQVLGADITVCDDCLNEKNRLNTMSTNVENQFEQQREATDKRINALQAQIEATIREIQELQSETEVQVAAIADRCEKVSEIENFFNVDLPPAEG